MVSDGATVQSVMVEWVRKVFPETPALKAAETMARAKIRHLVVTNTDGNVVGVFSQRDVLKHFSSWLSEVSADTDSSPPFHVREVMSTPPITVAPDTPLREAAAMMVSENIGCLPVVDRDGRLVGVMSSVDLLASMADGHSPEASN